MPPEAVLRPSEAVLSGPTVSPPTSIVAASPRPDDLVHCEQLLAVGSKSFSAAARLLPVRIRPAVTTFYAFCRVADDLVDEGGDPARAVKTLEHRLDDMYAGREPSDPVDRAFGHTIAHHQIPRAPLDALIDGFVWDAEGRHYETLSDVLAYSARVASAVGVVMTVIMGARDRDVLARACDLGAAMQLTNIARDVGEDARRGRLYLPAAWLREEGVDPDTWLANPRFDPALGRVVRRLLASADALYRRSRAGVGSLPPDCRASIRAASSIYADIGRVIARRDYDSISARASTTTLRKVWLLAWAWLSRHDDDRELHAAPLPEVEFLLE